LLILADGKGVFSAFFSIPFLISPHSGKELPKSWVIKTVHFVFVALEPGKNSPSDITQSNCYPLIKKKRKFSSYIRIFRGIRCKVIYD
jgi:hypothetical protein